MIAQKYPKMGSFGKIKVLALILLLTNLSELGLSKKFEPYEILGVHRRATQQEIRSVLFRNWEWLWWPILSVGDLQALV